MLATTKTNRLGAVGTLVRFGLLALVPVVLLGAVLAAELNADVQQRYLDSSRTSATLITQVGIQPLLDPRLLSEGLTTDQVAQIDGKLQGAAVSDEVRRLKVWNRSGMIVYSDNHALIARTFPIDEDLGAALNGHPSASVTDGHDEENAGDNLAGPLIQVYVPLVFKGSSSPSGAFEVYLPYAPVQAAIDHESRQLYLLLGAGLALFYASMFPIVLFADRWRRRAESTAMANLTVLERLNRLKSEFLIRMSHQFRTSMVGIEGFAEVIRDSDRLDPNELRAFASDIYADAKRLDRAFNEMLELDQMETGRISVGMAPADLNQLINEVVDATRKENPARSITTDLAPALPAVPCDADKMAQVLANLVSNAIRYSRDDVSVSSATEGDYLKVSVTDHGPGMPAEFDSRLFVGHSNGTGMTGLGLPIARQVVEMHGGRLWFESISGGGTAFHFTLPLKLRPSRQLKAVARA
jgi:signal transduction histidine kinase